MELCLNRVRHWRARRLVLEIPDLTIRSGRVTAVLGPNGAGKTTLLRLLAGLETATEGEVRIGPHQAGAAARNLVSIAFQRAVLLAGTVLSNLDLALRLRGLDRTTRQRRIERVAEVAGIAGLLPRSARSLSVGEAQRVNLARTLSFEAPVTLLDEPLSGLDPVARRKLLYELPRILASFATTVVLVTHDGEEARLLADDQVVLVAGQMCAHGSLDDVWHHPGSAVVAEILGYQILDLGMHKFAVQEDGFGVEPPGRPVDVLIEHIASAVASTDLLCRVDRQLLRVALRGIGKAPPTPSWAPGDHVTLFLREAVELQVSRDGQ